MPSQPPHSCDEMGAEVLDVRSGSLEAEHFGLSEFRCTGGTPILLLHPRLTTWLDLLREWAGAPVEVTSGYRTHAYNAKIGGADESRHMYGLAADVKAEGKAPGEVASWAGRQGFGGVGRYESFTHLDVFGENRRWDRR
ncbi:YcbK family protein [Salinibacter altiplanensis]|uniref:YcbK family protein n=1 Tax=Salinibacter altiplanensis TaxID=1803181 RepID=UPI000C9F1EF6|nr:D-Ala-D-Ala carboxypeptidase family metallohydrolase [Salinibacter altiplanensis]